MNNYKNELAKRISQGDTSAEKELFLCYKEKIETIIRNRLGINHPDWQDVFSETQMAILVAIRAGKFDPNKGNLDAYIYGIVVNQIKLYSTRSGKKEQTYIEDIPLKYLVNPVDKTTETTSEILDILYQDIIRKLKPKYKQVLYLRYYQGMGIQEIAKQLGVEPRRISERINYAIKLVNKKRKK